MRALFILAFSVTNFVLSSYALTKDGKCRILSLRGGGVHGAFEVGVLKALADKMPPGEIEYDYIAGVSIGAYNASILATFPIGKE